MSLLFPLYERFLNPTHKFIQRFSRYLKKNFILPTPFFYEFPNKFSGPLTGIRIYIGVVNIAVCYKIIGTKILFFEKSLYAPTRFTQDALLPLQHCHPLLFA